MYRNHWNGFQAGTSQHPTWPIDTRGLLSICKLFIYKPNLQSIIIISFTLHQLTNYRNLERMWGIKYLYAVIHWSWCECMADGINEIVGIIFGHHFWSLFSFLWSRDVMSVGITQSLSSIWPDSELIKDLRKTASSAPPSGWLWPRSVICVLKEDLVEGLSSGEWGGACDNHDDGEALPVILCDTCGNLCADCDRFLHLQSKTSCKTSWSWRCQAECQEYQLNSCSKINPCWHACGGIVNEDTCLRCLQGCDKSAKLKQDTDDMCMIFIKKKCEISNV